jgi:hypothetical protein
LPSSSAVPGRSANVVTVTDGRIARVELFLRHADAYDAIGLSE